MGPALCSVPLALGAPRATEEGRLPQALRAGEATGSCSSTHGWSEEARGVAPSAHCSRSSHSPSTLLGSTGTEPRPQTHRGKGCLCCACSKLQNPIVQARYNDGCSVPLFIKVFCCPTKDT